MESDGPLDKFASSDNSKRLGRRANLSGVNVRFPWEQGFLSPIEEHPSDGEGSKYPSQIILHPLEPVSFGLSPPPPPSLSCDKIVTSIDSTCTPRGYYITAYQS